MSKRKKKPFSKPQPKEKTYSIARALNAFAPDEETYLCAFLQAAEDSYKKGYIRGWGLTHDETGKYEVSIIEHDTGGIIPILAPTLKEAVKAFSQELIKLGMQGAAQA